MKMFYFSESPKHFLMDGVYVSASGRDQIQSQMVVMEKKKSRNRAKKVEPTAKHPHMARLLSLSDKSLDGDDQDDKSRNKSQTLIIIVALYKFCLATF